MGRGDNKGIFDRLLVLDQRLLIGLKLRGFSAELGVTEKTIRRDIQTIRSLGSDAEYRGGMWRSTVPVFHVNAGSGD